MAYPIKKFLFIDDYLRVGIYEKDEPMPGVPGMRIVKIRPFGFEGLWKVIEIPNIPESSLHIITRDKLGNISTFEGYVLSIGAVKDSPLLKYIDAKYHQLIEENLKLKQELGIRRATEISKTIQYSKDSLAELERLREMSKKLSEIMKPKKSGLRTFMREEVE